MDAVIFYGGKFQDDPELILIERAKNPIGWALPGGHVEYGEDLEAAVKREVKEETGLDIVVYEQFYTYSLPDRDPRSHTMSTVFICRADKEQTPIAGDDAAKVHVVPLDEARRLQYAFDHAMIIEDVVKYAIEGGSRRRKGA